MSEEYKIEWRAFSEFGALLDLFRPPLHVSTLEEWDAGTTLSFQDIPQKPPVLTMSFHAIEDKD